MKSEAIKTRDYYRSLRYAINLRKDEDGDWIARVEELPGCIAHGANPAEALDNIEEAKVAWIDDALEAGDGVPEPDESEALPSGKWLQRVPRSLHKKIAELAAKEGVSLNQLVTSILAEAVGRRHAATLPYLEASASVPVRLLPHRVAGKPWTTLSDAVFMSITESSHDWHVEPKIPIKQIKIVDALVSPVSSLPNKIDENQFRIIERAAKKEFTHKA